MILYLFFSHVTCNDPGSITVYAKSDTFPLIFKLEDDADFSDNNKFTNLAKGYYNIVVKDPKNRQVTEEFFVKYLAPTTTIFPVNDGVCVSMDSFQFEATTKNGYWMGNNIDPETGIINPSELGQGLFKFVFTHNDCPRSQGSIKIEIFNSLNATINIKTNLCLNQDSILLSADPSGGIWTGNGVSSNRLVLCI